MEKLSALLDRLNAVGEVVGIWLTNLVNSFLTALGLPVTVIWQVLFVIFVGILAILLFGFIWPSRERSQHLEAKDPKEVKPKGPMKKVADLLFFEVKSVSRDVLKWERTGRGLVGMYLVERLGVQEKAEKGLLVIRFNGDWFFFRNTKSISGYQVSFMDGVVDAAKRGNLGFKWSSVSWRVVLEYLSTYEVEVQGHYPHLLQENKRVRLVLAELGRKELDIVNDDEDKYLLFEEIELFGGILWQDRKVYLWEGDRLDEAEVAEIQELYLDEAVEFLELEPEWM